MFHLTRGDVGVLLLAAVLSIFIHRRDRRRRPPYPPGPKGIPILGNLFDFPQKDEWLTYNKWSKECRSDIIYVHAAGNDVIVLNSKEAIDDLLEKQSSIYSSRPRLPMTIELMDCDWAFSLVPYGQQWRERRRVFSKYFQPSKADLYQRHQIKFVHDMLSTLLDTPAEFLSHLRQAVAGSALAMSYGIPIQNKDDPYIMLAEESVKTMSDSATPGHFLVNLIPSLQHVPEFMPGGGFKTKARVFKQSTEKLLNEPFRALLRAMDAGIATPSFASSALEDLLICNQDDASTRRKIVMDVAATAFAGAADTTLAAVTSFMAAMLISPHAQRMAHEELDRVLSGRLPDFDDEHKLPYILAIVREVLRWGVITPIAIPHRATEDNIYKGYYIPKGATIIANTWAILRDEMRYGPDTTAFKPERFLKDGKIDPNVQDPSAFVFGYGRRACPGRHVALSLLFLLVASTLTVFEISEDIDDAGNPIPPNLEWHSGVISEPKPFKCTIKARSQNAEDIIRRTQVSEEI